MRERTRAGRWVASDGGRSGRLAGDGSVPDDPAAAHSDLDEDIRRALTVAAGQWSAADRVADGAKRRLLDMARRRSRRRIAGAGAAAVVLLVGVLVGVLAARPSSHLLAAGAQHRSSLPRVVSGTGVGPHRCVLIQVGAAPAVCGGVVVASNQAPIGNAGFESAGSGSAGSGSAGSASAAFGALGDAAPSASASGAGSASGTPVSGTRPADGTDAGTTRTDSPSPNSPVESAPEAPEAPELVVELRVGQMLRLTLPALPAMSWALPAPSGAAGVVGRVAASAGPAGSVLVRFVALRPGSTVLAASASAGCTVAHRRCTARWQWHVTVRVFGGGGT